MNQQPVQAPLGYQLFQKLLSVSNVKAEDERSLLARLTRWGVVQGVQFLRWRQAMEFPARGTGGWWWLWRWKFEMLMGWFEWESLVWTRRLVKPGMTVIDLGANVGYYTRLFSDLVGPRGRVFAFEPNPENLVALRSNLSSPRYSNVEICPFAASDQDGTATLFVSPGHSNHSLIEGYTAAETKLEIPVVTIDRFLKNREIAAVDFVKMDIEGGESRALQGMRETIRSSPRFRLLVECNPLALRSAGSTPADFLRLISSLGLNPEAILEDASLGLLPDVTTIDLYVNLLCSRQ